MSASASSWLESAFARAADVSARYLNGGQPLGDFVMSEMVLGEGGYGKVYKGKNRRTAEDVAIKEIATGRMRAQNIVKEVAILRRVGHHPNIIQLQAYHEVGDKHYIVLEAVTGGELFKQVEKRGCLPETEARGFFVQLIDGVAHIHSKGVAHRDLKLENVLLDFTERVVKIIDFGLAHPYKPRADGTGFEHEKLRHFCGSKSYCPAEMLASMEYDGFLADVYSLGVCLFALLTGFFPLEEACGRDWRFAKVLRAQQAGESTVAKVFAFYRKPVPLSAAAVELLDAMLQLDPRRRCSLDFVLQSAYYRGVAAALPAAPSSPLVNFPPAPADGGAGAVSGAGGGAGAAAEGVGAGAAAWDRTLEVDGVDAQTRGTTSLLSTFSADGSLPADYYDDEDDAPVNRSLSPPPPPTLPTICRQQAVSTLQAAPMPASLVGSDAPP